MYSKGVHTMQTDQPIQIQLHTRKHIKVDRALLCLSNRCGCKPTFLFKPAAHQMEISQRLTCSFHSQYSKRRRHLLTLYWSEQISANQHHCCLSSAAHLPLSWSSGRICPRRETAEGRPAGSRPPDWPSALPRTASASGSRSREAGSGSAGEGVTQRKHKRGGIGLCARRL